MRVQLQKDVSSNSQTVWHIDPSRTTVEFEIKSLLFLKVRGRVNVVEGQIVLDEADISRSSVVATLRSDSIATGIQRRDKHLCSADFLDGKRYPDIEFQSSRVGRGRDIDVIEVTGSLTIKEKSALITLEVSQVDRSRSPQGEEVLYYCATTEIDRFAFGINYGPGVIGRKLKVTINAQASRKI